MCITSTACTPQKCKKTPAPEQHIIIIFKINMDPESNYFELSERENANLGLRKCMIVLTASEASGKQNNPQQKTSLEETGLEPSNEASVGDFCSCCMDGEVYDDDEIVFCDKCNVACHQQCYGIAHVPKGSWYNTFDCIYEIDSNNIIYAI